ncbi:5'-methylthioadenosine/S-adenosylhomocysteine nucleosidase family protein [Anthocerotibacter panamensis]|uniref:5'-methylthioadenosine/S-adenosylhomocysteine nucleosidase family protein n=1 Tax=Anthocerotibacter panamensis TaxID=2857077 RepID=UPI001C402610|nr:hypothetical protein [Anthocerotibacter panamensis]
MGIDAILVPRGAEFQAVQRSCRNGPPVLAVPAGPALASYLEALPAHVNWKRVLLMGLCGSLAARYAVGDVVLYRACVSPSGQTALCDLELRTALARVLPAGTAQVVALTSPTVVAQAEQKRLWRKQSGAEVVDMEGQVAQRILAGRGIAVGMVRVVSDDSEHDLPDLKAAFDAQGDLQPLALAWALLRSPVAGARLVQGSLKSLQVLEQVARGLAQAWEDSA